MASASSLVKIAAICMLVLSFGSELLEARSGSVLQQKPEALELAERVSERTCTTGGCISCKFFCEKGCRPAHWPKPQECDAICAELCYDIEPEVIELTEQLLSVLERVCKKDGCKACESQCRRSFWMSKELLNNCLRSCDDGSF